MKIKLKATLLALFSAIAGVFITNQVNNFDAAIILYQSGNTMYGYIPHVYVGLFAAAVAWAIWGSILLEAPRTTEGDTTEN